MSTTGFHASGQEERNRPIGGSRRHETNPACPHEPPESEVLHLRSAGVPADEEVVAPRRERFFCGQRRSRVRHLAREAGRSGPLCAASVAPAHVDGLPERTARVLTTLRARRSRTRSHFRREPQATRIPPSRRRPIKGPRSSFARARDPRAHGASRPRSDDGILERTRLRCCRRTPSPPSYPDSNDFAATLLPALKRPPSSAPRVSPSDIHPKPGAAAGSTRLAHRPRAERRRTRRRRRRDSRRADPASTHQ